MAYNNYSNPDALPAHAEPDQAAQILSGGGQPQQQGYRPPPPQGRGGPDPYGRPQQQHHNPPPQGYGRPPQPQPGYGSPHPQQQGYGSPHPQQQGYGSPHPQQQGYGRPPPTPAPPAGQDPTLYPLFKAVDKDGSGQLSERELRAALVNGDWTSFDPHTVRMMIRMFDTDRSGTIGFNEFCGLWGFLASWRALFDRFDTDRSGNISYNEFSNALAAFGYRLSPQFVQLLFRSYDRRGQEPSAASPTSPAPPQPQQGQNAISFDLFVQSCISLKRMTEVFKKYDDDRDGYITLSFEEFLTEILRQR
ncbi:EF-hand [Ascodesmis nigricans]|uniref:EF-hand n=1 Tax=Ascodesmis nigricans TaxID=341454 RepID=A0A4S2MZ28_9PEZI|nr:EF-hand [Ascodesmis nigricans]